MRGTMHRLASRQQASLHLPQRQNRSMAPLVLPRSHPMATSTHSNRPRARTSAAAAPIDLQLKRTKLGSSDLVVSEVCLGTMTWGEQNTEVEAHQQLSFAADCGVNFVDTAEIYPVAPRPETANATSTILGNWLAKQKRENFVIASKVTGRSIGMEWIPANRTQPPGQRQRPMLDTGSIVAAAEAELRRLQTDYIDLFQIHWPDRYYPSFGHHQYRLEGWQQHVQEHGPPVGFEEQVLAMGKLMEQGKIRAWGLSNETTFGVMQHCSAADKLGVARPATIQNHFSLVQRSFESELAEACALHHYNLGLLPWSALAGGSLSGKYLDGALPPKSRFQLFGQRYARFNSPRVQAAVREYSRIAQQAGLTPAQLALAFCRSRWFIPSVIVGATSVGQLRENLGAFASGASLSGEVLAAIDEVHLRMRNPALID